MNGSKLAIYMVLHYKSIFDSGYYVQLQSEDRKYRYVHITCISDYNTKILVMNSFIYQDLLYIVGSGSKIRNV